MKAFGLVIFTILYTVSSSKNIEDRIKELSYQLDSFEFAFYQIREFRREITEVGEALEEVQFFSALLVNTVKVEEKRVKSNLRYLITNFLKLKFAERRIPRNSRDLVYYAFAEYAERRIFGDTMKYSTLLSEFSYVLTTFEQNYREIQEFVREFRDSQWTLSQILSLLILERKETLRALRKEAMLLVKVRPDVGGFMEERGKAEMKLEDFILPLFLMDIIGVKKLGNGVFFYAVKGRPVRAVKGGIVVYSGWLRGYGNTVIIKHNGYYSVYAHLDVIYVKNAAKIFTGTEIGEVGDTSSLYGTGLYFELRYGKKAIEVENVYKKLWKEVKEK